MRFRRQLERVKQSFAYDEVFQLFLRYCAGELAGQEQQRMDAWIASVPDREAIYRSINKTIEHLKQLETNDPEQVREVLERVKEDFPNVFGKVPDHVSYFLLPGILKANLGTIQWQLCRQIVYAGRWMRVVAIGVRLAVVLLFILILIQIWTINQRKERKQFRRPAFKELKNELNAKAVIDSFTVVFGDPYRVKCAGR